MRCNVVVVKVMFAHSYSKNSHERANKEESYALLKRSVLSRRRKFGYTTEVLKVTDMLQNADNMLFSLMFRSSPTSRF